MEGDEIMIKMSNLIKQRNVIRKQTGMKINEAAEIEDVQHLEAEIFDAIIAFKKTFEKSEWKKNRKINTLIKQMFKLESTLGYVVGDLE